MNEDEKILDKLKKVLGEEVVADMSAEELKPFFEHPEMLKDFGISAPTAEENTAVKGFADYCPDIMKNPVTAQWIEKEGDKARVFAVKMAGVLDSPQVGPELKQVISSPEGLVGVYYKVDEKAARMDDVMRRYSENQTNLEELQKLEKELFDPKNNAYVILVRNDQVVLDANKHWEQCYSIGKSSQQTVLDVLAEEAHDYHKKEVVAAEEKTALEALAKRKDRSLPPSTEVKNSVHKLTIPQVYSILEHNERE